MSALPVAAGGDPAARVPERGRGDPRVHSVPMLADRGVFVRRLERAPVAPAR